MILIFSNKPDSPYILPYLYKRNMKRNILSHWAFINNRGQQAKHTVDHYEEISEEPASEEVSVKD